VNSAGRFASDGSIFLLAFTGPGGPTPAAARVPGRSHQNRPRRHPKMTATAAKPAAWHRQADRACLAARTRMADQARARRALPLCRPTAERFCRTWISNRFGDITAPRKAPCLPGMRRIGKICATLLKPGLKSGCYPAPTCPSRSHHVCLFCPSSHLICLAWGLPPGNRRTISATTQISLAAPKPPAKWPPTAMHVHALPARPAPDPGAASPRRPRRPFKKALANAPARLVKLVVSARQPQSYRSTEKGQQSLPGAKTCEASP